MIKAIMIICLISAISSSIISFQPIGEVSQKDIIVNLVYIRRHFTSQIAKIDAILSKYRIVQDSSISIQAVEQQLGVSTQLSIYLHNKYDGIVSLDEKSNLVGHLQNLATLVDKEIASGIQTLTSVKTSGGRVLVPKWWKILREILLAGIALIDKILQ